MGEKVDLIITAGQLVTCSPGRDLRKGSSMRDAGVLSPGALAISGDRIIGVGSPAEILSRYNSGGNIEALSSVAVPGLVDAHTHPIFAGSRLDEYLLRAKGATYLEIHQSGGGIMSTVRASRAAGDEELLERLGGNLDRMMMHGTTTAEAKSGYGLSTPEELRQLRLLKKIQGRHPMELVVTFLGAHTFPEEHRDSHQDYIDKIRDEMLPEIARERLAEYMDIFCEKGAFTLDEARILLESARNSGLGLKIHAEQFSSSGSALMAARLGAASCDHLLHLSRADIDEMRKYDTTAIFMPSTELFLNISEYGPARDAIDRGIAVALGTDFNAGSCLSESMPMAMSLSVLHMGLEPEEAILAATVNAAHSMGRGQLVGSIEPGKQADILILDIADYREWLYHFGVNFVKTVIKKGKTVFERGDLMRE